MPLVYGKNGEVLPDILLHCRYLNVLDTCYGHQRITAKMVEVVAVKEVLLQRFFCCGVVGLGEYIRKPLATRAGYRRKKSAIPQSRRSDSACCHHRREEWTTVNVLKRIKSLLESARVKMWESDRWSVEAEATG